VRGARHNALEDTEYCLQGTRAHILQDLAQWVTTGTSPVFWLSSPAGTGKTAIARTFCLWLKNCNMLGAGFFAIREESRQDASSIIRTIAYDLAMSHPTLSSLIVDAIRSHSDIRSLSTREQLDILVLEPLRAAVSDKSFPTLVLVIDGLNDCKRDDGVPAGCLIPRLVAFLQTLSGSIKLFVSSSNENGVQTLFKKHHIEPHLLTRYDVLPDILLYYRQNFEVIARDRGCVNWPSEKDITTLAIMTDHFFIFASTVKRYLSNERYDPVVRLQRLLESRDGQFGALDALYRNILHDSALDPSGREDDELRKRVQMILATVAFAKKPLLLADIARILKLNRDESKHDLVELSSVIVVPNDYLRQSVRFFHGSFVDFLCNKERCSDLRFFLDPPVEHAALASRCLNSIFRFIEAKFPDRRLPDQLPGHVQYACQYWSAHAAESSASDVPLNTAIKTLLDGYLASWIESCSLLRCIDTAVAGLRTLADSLKVHRVAVSVIISHPCVGRSFRGTFRHRGCSAFHLSICGPSSGFGASGARPRPPVWTQARASRTDDQSPSRPQSRHAGPLRASRSDDPRSGRRPDQCGCVALW
jgi:hypothetical protein